MALSLRVANENHGLAHRDRLCLYGVYDLRHLDLESPRTVLVLQGTPQVKVLGGTDSSGEVTACYVVKFNSLKWIDFNRV
jgi:hypothetical protein